MRVIHNLQAALAHWVYTKEEWESFQTWEKKRKGGLRYLLFRLFGKLPPGVPEITITGQKVWINDDSFSFLDYQHKLRRVNIRDTGGMNILEINYEQINARPGTMKELRIPVPKGKLREAIEVFDCLSANTF